MLYYSTFLFTLCMLIGYTGLLIRRMKFPYYIVLFSYFFLLNIIAKPLIGYWTIILMILGGSTITYLGGQKDLLNTFFSLLGHLIIILVHFLCYILINLFDISLIFTKKCEIHSIFLIATNLIVLATLRRLIVYSKIYMLTEGSKRLIRSLYAELFIIIFILTVIFPYIMVRSDSTEMPLIHKITMFAPLLFTMLILCNIYHTLKQNHELFLQIKEAETLQEYTKHIEGFYEEIHIFRHDCKNILSTLQYYIDNGNIKALQQYYHNKILPDTEILSNNDFYLSKLYLIEDPALKSLIYTKLITILNYNLLLTLELTETIPNLPMDSLILCRVLGILLDNAIEASLESTDKNILLAIVYTETEITFIITNSTLPLKAPVSRLSDKGYSTKINHSGLGLSTAARLIDPLPHVSLTTEYQAGFFRQTLEIQKG